MAILLAVSSAANLGCRSESDPEAAAEQFLRAYYVEINLNAALAAADGLARAKIEKSLALTAGNPQDEGTRRPRVFYERIGAETLEGESRLLYRITIRPPQFSEIVKEARLTLRRRDDGWKVTQFMEYEGGVPE